MSNTMKQILLEKRQSILYQVFLSKFLFMLTLLSRSTWTKSWDARWSVKMESYKAMLFIKASIISPSILTNCLTKYHWVRYVRGKHRKKENKASLWVSGVAHSYTNQGFSGEARLKEDLQVAAV